MPVSITIQQYSQYQLSVSTSYQSIQQYSQYQLSVNPVNPVSQAVNTVVQQVALSMQRISSTGQPCRVSFYTDLHRSTVNYSELASLAQRRLTLLRSVETLHDHRAMDMSCDDDELSHFACRLVTATVPWACQWFIAAETRLFRARLAALNLSEIKCLFYTVYMRRAHGLCVRDGVTVVGHGTRFVADMAVANDVDDGSDILVYFSHAPELVMRGRVRLEGGYFTLQEDHLVPVLVNVFRHYLTERMDILRTSTALQSDDRFTTFTIDIFAASGKTAEQLRDILDCSPPCIGLIVKRMRRHRHLKHNDRQVLIRHLKECGLPVDNCIDFFRSNFSCDQARFDREFVYLIRHNYGLEGKRADYPCYPCYRIMDMQACPFVSRAQMHAYLDEHGMADIEDAIFEDADGRNGVKGCTRLLAHVTGSKDVSLVASPYKYFETCRRMRK